MTDEIVRYVKQYVVGEIPVYLGVVVGIGPGKVGWAKTHENDRDKWDRKKGLLIARGRAALPPGAHRMRMLEKIPDGFKGAVMSMLRECEALA